MINLMFNTTKSFLSKQPFRQEIMIVLALKIIGLFLLWYFFFSHPHETLQQEQLAQHFIVDQFQR